MISHSRVTNSVPFRDCRIISRSFNDLARLARLEQAHSSILRENVPLACAWRQEAEAYRDAEFALTLHLHLERAPASCGQLRCRLGHCSAVFWGSFRRWTVVVSPSLWSPRLFWRCSPDLSVGFRVFARTWRCSHRRTGWRGERSAPIRGERATAATRVTCARARVA